MAWYFQQQGVLVGPLSAAEVLARAAAGELGVDTPVSRDEMRSWQPWATLAALAAQESGAAGLGSLAVARSVCSQCGRSLPATEVLTLAGRTVCADCKPLYLQHLREGAELPSTIRYASIGRRFLARLVDGVLIGGINFAITFGGFALLGQQIMASPEQAEEAQPLFLAATCLTYIVSMLLAAAYEVVMLRRWGATLGKMAVRVKVVTAEGGPLSWGRSIGRHFGNLLSGMTLFIGYVIAFGDAERRTLHDRLCNTRVIDRP